MSASVGSIIESYWNHYAPPNNPEVSSASWIIIQSPADLSIHWLVFKWFTVRTMAHLGTPFQKNVNVS